MQLIKSPKEFQKLCLGYRCSGLKVALVPTMGFFHKGHESLMQQARQVSDKLIVSHFVNPTQFGVNEDLSCYPKDISRDLDIALENNVDIVFMPEASDMFTWDHAAWVEVPELSNCLCGIVRPEHFKGVCTVVLKLFCLSLPHFAFFGEKDWQQLAILRKLVFDLNLSVEIRSCPIVREEDGLALSSRNTYLSLEERARAVHLYKGLLLAKELVLEGLISVQSLDKKVREYWLEHLPLSAIDYLEFVNPDTLKLLPDITGSALALAALRIGKTRLIDNLHLN